MRGFIFAAGLGTRLRPLTDTMPKALVPVCGKPLLAHVADRLIAEGFDELVVNVHHFPEQIRDFLSVFYPYATVSDESDCLLETGGAVLHARPLLEGCGKFLVHNVDIISDISLRDFAASSPEDAVATLAVSERRTRRYLLFDDDMRLMGWTDTATGEVRSPYGNLDVSKYRMLAFSGIHLISDSVFPLMEEAMDGEERFPIMDFYLRICRDHPVAGYDATGSRLVDVGKYGSLGEAEAEAAAILRTISSGRRP